MARVLVGELKQETATFNPTPTRRSDFQIVSGQPMIDAYQNTHTELAGAFEVFGADAVTVVPTTAAAAVSGGPIPATDLDRLIGDLTDAAQRASNIDGVYLCLHGAMAGAQEPDPEGALLREFRRLFPQLPIVVSLDLHAVLTDRMTDAADVLVPYHTYPHVDHFETGRRAAQILMAMMRGEVRPITARVPLPMLVRGDELLTDTGRFGEAIRMCKDIEASAKGLAAGVIIGNAFTDVPALQSNILVTTDDDQAGADQAAEAIGRFMWGNRELFQATLTSLDDAINQARQCEGLVVFSDAADATSSGASGDSNAILRGLLDARFPKRTLLSLVDEPAVAAAFAAGVGAQFDTSLGGTRDPSRFQPLPTKIQVVSLHTDPFTYEDGTLAQAGRVAVLRCENAWILTSERPLYVVGRRVFEAHGLRPPDFDLVVVKSPNGFRTWYESIAALIVPVDVPGSTSANLHSLPFKNCIRPIFPLDDEVPSPFRDTRS